MSAPVTLRPRGALPIDLDGAALRPGLSRAQIESSPLTVDGAVYPAAHWFEVRGDDAMHLVLEGDCRPLRRLGAGLTAGRITVAGDAGDELGLGMSGGEILVQGSAGHHAGAEMSGGLLDIGGACGDFAGGALAGNRQGMRGGLLHVRGNAGDRAADCMRRGVLIIDGASGDYLGSRMLAGTVIAGGTIGVLPGYGLKRGTLLLRSMPHEPPGYFKDCGVHVFDFVTLLARSLKSHVALSSDLRYRRWCGDLATGGYGEILIPA